MNGKLQQNDQLQRNSAPCPAPRTRRSTSLGKAAAVSQLSSAARQARGTQQAERTAVVTGHTQPPRYCVCACACPSANVSAGVTTPGAQRHLRLRGRQELYAESRSADTWASQRRASLFRRKHSELAQCRASMSVTTAHRLNGSSQEAADGRIAKSRSQRMLKV